VLHLVKFSLALTAELLIGHCVIGDGCLSSEFSNSVTVSFSVDISNG